ncbi:hypothetical protein Sjap_018316 [Stephania japonica]|uniref:Uncharacterized protein n=1 Tax=Stephania japonica TaxID=461633 RepID=A0AAP0I7R2_9MAGN
MSFGILSEMLAGYSRGFSLEKRKKDIIYQIEASLMTNDLRYNSGGNFYLFGIYSSSFG